MEIRETISAILKGIIRDLTDQDITPHLEHPKEAIHGDYSSNIALVLGKEVKQSPLEIAKKIAEKFSSPIVEKVDIAGSGFINFYLSRDFLINQLGEVIRKKDKYGWSTRLLRQLADSARQRKIMLEFAHPNTHKEFHIGHLRNITLGEAIARILEADGRQITRTNYQGDVGLHVAKALYGFEKLQAEFKDQDKSLDERVKFLGRAYTLGSKAYEENESAVEEIIEINRKIYQRNPDLMPLWEKTRKWSLDYFESIYTRLGTHFDRLYFESEVYEPGKKIVLANIDNGIFKKDDEAIIFDGEKYGLHKRVFITKEGNPTYEGKEMGLAPLQYQENNFDKAIHLVGPEQAGYFAVVFKALGLIDPVFEGKELHLSYGLVRLKTGKMSSRMGNVVAGTWLLNEVKSRIKKEFKDMDEDTAEKVTVSAVKYSMLKFAVSSDISFSFDESISLEGDSGPYLQYTYARAKSVLRRANFQFLISNLNSNFKFQISNLENEELSLLRTIHRFPEVVEEAAEKFAPNIICNYLFDLAQKFNLFYQKHKIIESDKKEFRLSLTAAVGQILKNGLYLLGIEAPGRM